MPTAGKQVATRPHSGRRSPLILAGVAIFSALGLAVIAYFLVPSATITIIPASRIVSDTFEVTADVNERKVELARRRIPAQRVQLAITISDWLHTSGKRAVPDRPAKGEVAFVNLTSRPVTVPKGSRVGTDDGIWFTTDAEVEVPPKGSLEQASVSITAVRPGSGGNVPALSIQRIGDNTLRFSLRVLNESATHGGGDRFISYVTGQDRARLEEKTIEKARQEGGEELQRRLAPARAFYPQTVEATLSDERFDHMVGEDAEVLGLEATATVSALAFDQRDLEALARAHFEGEGRGQIMEGSLRTRLQEVSAWNQEAISFRLYAQGRLASLVEWEPVKQALAGMSIEQARNYLSQNLRQVDDVQIELHPGWIGNLPWFSWRIEVKVLGVE